MQSLLQTVMGFTSQLYTNDLAHDYRFSTMLIFTVHYSWFTVITQQHIF